MAHIFIFGLGFSGSHIAAKLRSLGWQVSGTGGDDGLDFADETAVRAELAKASHVLSSVPPFEGSDPVLSQYGDALTHDWLGYLSSTGVYGDTDGAWVDESAPIGGGRRPIRAKCDAQWMGLGARIFRLPGIYGPGRSAFDRIAQGKARRIDAAGQVFSRVHVDDIASGVIAGLDAPKGAYNLADDLPASQSDVIAEACTILGIAPPPLQILAEAGLSAPAAAYYSENRRISNHKAQRVLKWKPAYPDYRSGLRAIAGDHRNYLKRSAP